MRQILIPNSFLSGFKSSNLPKIPVLLLESRWPVKTTTKKKLYNH